jgi:hypothetical protein
LLKYCIAEPALERSRHAESAQLNAPSTADQARR